MRGAASRLPVWKTLFGSWLLCRASTERMIVNRSSIAACFGRCSQNRTPGSLRGDDAERTTVLERAVGLGVPGVDLAGAASHPEQDDGLAAPDRPAGLRGAGPVTEQARQAQPGQARQAGLDQVAAAGDNQALPLQRVEVGEGVPVIVLLFVLVAHVPALARCIVLIPPLGVHYGPAHDKLHSSSSLLLDQNR